MKSIRDLQQKRKQWLRKGFTLAELLIVVAIITVLGGIGVMAASSYARKMDFLKANKTAEEIYLASQHHLSVSIDQDHLQTKINQEISSAGASSFLGEKLSNGTYLIQSDQNNSILDYMLPFGSIEDSVRNGKYVIQYHAESGRVLYVYYADKKEATLSELVDYAKRDLAPEENRKPIYGRYGSMESFDSGLSMSDLSVIVKNDDRLTASVYVPKKALENAGLPKQGQSMLITLVVKDASAPDAASAASKEAELGTVTYSEDTNSVSYDISGADAQFTVSLVDLESGSSGTETAKAVEVVLDDIRYDAAKNNHFAALFNGFEPGCDISVSAKLTSSDTAVKEKISNTVKTNSLFAEIADDEKITADEAGTDPAVRLRTAHITSLRHLENLDPEISGLPTASASPVVQAIQLADLDWNSWKSQNDQVTNKDRTVLNSDTKYGFIGIANPNLTAYSGSGNTISNLTAESSSRLSNAGENAALFRRVYDSMIIRDLTIQTSDITSSRNAAVLIAEAGTNGSAASGSACVIQLSGLVISNTASAEAGMSGAAAASAGEIAGAGILVGNVNETGTGISWNLEAKNVSIPGTIHLKNNQPGSMVSASDPNSGSGLLVGRMTSAGSVSFLNVNDGSGTASQTIEAYGNVGGLIGIYSTVSGSSALSIDFDTVYFRGLNTIGGTVSSSGTPAPSAITAGGLIGSAAASSPLSIRTANTGSETSAYGNLLPALTCVSAKQNAGGMIGTISSSVAGNINLTGLKGQIGAVSSVRNGNADALNAHAANCLEVINIKTYARPSDTSADDVIASGGAVGRIFVSGTGSSAVSNILVYWDQKTGDKYDYGTLAIAKNGSAGGFVGRVDGSSNLTVSNCTSSMMVGDREAYDSANGAAGGFAGTIDASGLTLQNCYSAGHTITGSVQEETGEVEKSIYDTTNTNVIAGEAAGGFIGVLKNAASVSGCFTTASAESRRAAGGSGGFVGVTYVFPFDNCYASSDIGRAGMYGGFAGNVQGIGFTEPEEAVGLTNHYYVDILSNAQPAKDTPPAIGNQTIPEGKTDYAPNVKIGSNGISRITEVPAGETSSHPFLSFLNGKNYIYPMSGVNVGGNAFYGDWTVSEEPETETETETETESEEPQSLEGDYGFIYYELIQQGTTEKAKKDAEDAHGYYHGYMTRNDTKISGNKANHAATYEVNTKNTIEKPKGTLDSNTGLITGPDNYVTESGYVLIVKNSLLSNGQGNIRVHIGDDEGPLPSLEGKSLNKYNAILDRLNIHGFTAFIINTDNSSNTWNLYVRKPFIAVTSDNKWQDRSVFFFNPYMADSVNAAQNPLEPKDYTDYSKYDFHPPYQIRSAEQFSTLLRMNAAGIGGSWTQEGAPQAEFLQTLDLTFDPSEISCTKMGMASEEALQLTTMTTEFNGTYGAAARSRDAEGNITDYYHIKHVTTRLFREIRGTFKNLHIVDLSIGKPEEGNGALIDTNVGTIENLTIEKSVLGSQITSDQIGNYALIGSNSGTVNKLIVSDYHTDGHGIILNNCNRGFIPNVKDCILDNSEIKGCGFVSVSSSGTIQNCIISNTNVGSHGFVGEALYVGTGISGCSLVNCQIGGNGFAGKNSQAAIRNCTISNARIGSDGFAGEISNTDTIVEGCRLENCDIAGNGFAGSITGGYQSAQVSNCCIVNARIQKSGFANKISNTKVENCHIYSDNSVYQTLKDQQLENQYFAPSVKTRDPGLEMLSGSVETGYNLVVIGCDESDRGYDLSSARAGFAHTVESGTVSNCSVTGNLFGGTVGGFVYETKSYISSENGCISGSYANVIVTSNSNAAGFVYQNTATGNNAPIQYCHSIGKLKSLSASVYGFVCLQDNNVNSKISNSYSAVWNVKPAGNFYTFGPDHGSNANCYSNDYTLFITPDVSEKKKVTGSVSDVTDLELGSKSELGVQSSAACTKRYGQYGTDQTVGAVYPYRVSPENQIQYGDWYEPISIIITTNSSGGYKQYRIDVLKTFEDLKEEGKGIKKGDVFIFNQKVYINDIDVDNYWVQRIKPSSFIAEIGTTEIPRVQTDVDVVRSDPSSKGSIGEIVLKTNTKAEGGFDVFVRHTSALVYGYFTQMTRFYKITEITNLNSKSSDGLTAKDFVIDETESELTYVYEDETESEAEFVTEPVTEHVPDGSEFDPFVISTAEDFLNISNLTGDDEHAYWFVQTADLELPETAGAVIPGVFCGHYDGGGYTISGIHITDVSDTDENGAFSAGLFEENRGEISNLKLKGSIQLTAQKPGAYVVGSVCAVNKGTLADITSQVRIRVDGGNESRNASVIVGGLAGCAGDSVYAAADTVRNRPVTFRNCAYAVEDRAEVENTNPQQYRDKKAISIDALSQTKKIDHEIIGGIVGYIAGEGSETVRSSSVVERCSVHALIDNDVIGDLYPVDGDQDPVDANAPMTPDAFVGGLIGMVPDQSCIHVDKSAVSVRFTQKRQLRAKQLEKEQEGIYYTDPSQVSSIGMVLASDMDHEDGGVTGLMIGCNGSTALPIDQKQDGAFFADCYAAERDYPETMAEGEKPFLKTIPVVRSNQNLLARASESAQIDTIRGIVTYVTPERKLSLMPEDPTIENYAADGAVLRSIFYDLNGNLRTRWSGTNPEDRIFAEPDAPDHKAKMLPVLSGQDVPKDQLPDDDARADAAALTNIIAESVQKVQSEDPNFVQPGTAGSIQLVLPPEHADVYGVRSVMIEKGIRAGLIDRIAKCGFYYLPVQNASGEISERAYALKFEMKISDAQKAQEAEAGKVLKEEYDALRESGQSAVLSDDSDSTVLQTSYPTQDIYSIDPSLAGLIEEAGDFTQSAEEEMMVSSAEDGEHMQVMVYTLTKDSAPVTIRVWFEDTDISAELPGADAAIVTGSRELRDVEPEFAETQIGEPLTVTDPITDNDGSETIPQDDPAAIAENGPVSQDMISDTAGSIQSDQSAGYDESDAFDQNVPTAHSVQPAAEHTPITEQTLAPAAMTDMQDVSAMEVSAMEAPVIEQVLIA